MREIGRSQSNASMYELNPWVTSKLSGGCNNWQHFTKEQTDSNDRQGTWQKIMIMIMNDKQYIVDGNSNY